MKDHICKKLECVFCISEQRSSLIFKGLCDRDGDGGSYEKIIKKHDEIMKVLAKLR